MFGAELDEMPIERAVFDQIRDDDLLQILRVRIGALLDERQLLDDRLRGRQPAEPQSRRQHLREGVQMNHHRLRIERMERRRRRRAEVSSR